MAIGQTIGVGLVEMLQEGRRRTDPEDVAGRHARLEAALASLAHLLHLVAGTLAAAWEIVHCVERTDDALEPFVLVRSRTAAPLSALNLDELAHDRARLRQLRQELPAEPRLGLAWRHGTFWLQFESSWQFRICVSWKILKELYHMFFLS